MRLRIHEYAQKKKKKHETKKKCFGSMVKFTKQNDYIYIFKENYTKIQKTTTITLTTSNFTLKFSVLVGR